MTTFTNSTDVTISDIGRLTFHEIVNGERTEIVSLSMRIEHLESLAETITQTLNQYKASTFK